MAVLPQVVRDEHKELRARIELLRTVADSKRMYKCLAWKFWRATCNDNG